MATEGLKIQKKQPTPFQLFSIFSTLQFNVPPEPRSAQADFFTNQRESVPNQIKLLENSFPPHPTELRKPSLRKHG